MSDRTEPRSMLALVALTVELPMPSGVTFYPESSILSMSLRSVVDGLAWSAHLGGSADTYINAGNGKRYLSEGVIEWRGWRVQLHAWDDAMPDAPLPADTSARLTALVDFDACAREVADALRTAPNPQLH
jgi:hypothetical protein